MNLGRLIDLHCIEFLPERFLEARFLEDVCWRAQCVRSALKNLCFCSSVRRVGALRLCCLDILAGFLSDFSLIMTSTEEHRAQISPYECRRPQNSSPCPELQQLHEVVSAGTPASRAALTLLRHSLLVARRPMLTSTASTTGTAQV